MSRVDELGSRHDSYINTGEAVHRDAVFSLIPQALEDHRAVVAERDTFRNRLDDMRRNSNEILNQNLALREHLQMADSLGSALDQLDLICPVKIRVEGRDQDCGTCRKCQARNTLLAYKDLKIRVNQSDVYQ